MTPSPEALPRTPSTWRGTLALAVVLAGIAYAALWMVQGGPPDLAALRGMF